VAAMANCSLLHLVKTRRNITNTLMVFGKLLRRFTCIGNGRHTEARSEKRGNQMKDSTRDQVRGKLHEAKGKVKEEAGKLTNNPDLQAEGQDEKLGGKIQKKVGQVEKVLGK
jgi:uncharacterized protein YjbJ (UPF0337 family)